MDTFAFIIHPIDPKRDVSRKFPLLGRILNERQIDFFSTFFPPVYVSEIEGITSPATGRQIKGWFVACPYTPRRMLENLSRREVIRIEQLLHRREYRQDEVIFSQGDPGLGMYIILRGTVEIASEPSREVLAQLGEGDFLGELALLDESPRSATAIAITPCKMLCLFHPDLQLTSSGGTPVWA